MVWQGVQGLLSPPSLGGKVANCPVKRLKNKDLTVCHAPAACGKVAMSF